MCLTSMCFTRGQPLPLPPNCSAPLYITVLYLCTTHKSNNRRVFYMYFSGLEGVSLFSFIILLLSSPRCAYMYTMYRGGQKDKLAVRFAHK